MLKRKEFILEVSTSPIENVKAFRVIAESNDWSFATHEGSRLVDRFAIIIPMAQSARTLGLELKEGPLQGLEMNSWAETKGSAGAINMAAWTIPGGQGNEEAINVLTNSEVHVLIMLNPDGNDIDTRWNINQVDLNRNYDHYWNTCPTTQPLSLIHI